MAPGGDLGFSYEVRKSGEVVVSRAGKPVTTLRGKTAKTFLDRVAYLDPQQVMARYSGNYKRGNERRSSDRGDS